MSHNQKLLIKSTKCSKRQVVKKISSWQHFFGQVRDDAIPVVTLYRIPLYSYSMIHTEKNEFLAVTLPPILTFNIIVGKLEIT